MEKFRFRFDQEREGSALGLAKLRMANEKAKFLFPSDALSILKAFHVTARRPSVVKDMLSDCLQRGAPRIAREDEAEELAGELLRTDIVGVLEKEAAFLR